MQAGGEGVELKKIIPNLETEFLWIKNLIWNKPGCASVKPIYNPHFFLDVYDIWEKMLFVEFSFSGDGGGKFC